MKTTMKALYLGAAVLGVLLLGAERAEARKIGWLYGNGLHVESEPRNDSPDKATGAEDAYIAGDVEIEGGVYTVVPATQTVAAADTITADACGGLKRVSATGSPKTTSTTNTFTAPAAANKGCCMNVVNVGSVDIILDVNDLFPGHNNMTIAQYGSIGVCSDGTVWRKTRWTEY